MRLRKFLPLLLVAASVTTLSLVACRKSDSAPASARNTATVTTTLSGRILDENHNPVGGASVKAGNGTTTTNVNGEFTLAQVSVPASAAFVKVEKQGYFTGSRTLDVAAGREHYVSIELIPRRFVGSISATSGGTVDLGSGGSLRFDANGIITEADGAPYTGTVRIAAYTYDPTAANFAEVMPGALRALNSNNEERLLKSYAMVNIELEGAGGEKLQLASGKRATLTLAIPAGLQGTAPATIPLWYFDESKGLWIEEGSATKQGNQYVGTVAHFTPWNCDVPSDFVDYETVLVSGSTTASGIPIAQARVQLISAIGNGSMYTDNNGVLRLPMPINQRIEMNVFDRCNRLIHTESIGPFTASTSSTTYISNYYSATAVTFTGAVTNCNGQGVTNGYVQVLINGNIQRAAITNGTYSFLYPSCDSSVSALLTPVDLGANLQGATVTVTGRAGATASNALSACGQSSDQFVQFLFNNSAVRFQPPADSLIAWSYPGSQETYVYALPDAAAGQQQHNLALQLRGPFAAGAQTVLALGLTHNYLYYEMPVGGASAQISSYGSTHGFIEGTFSGTVRDSLGLNSFPVSGSFRVRRDN
ncbi:MAG: hypothetical protein EOO11_08220 [Chitinophagaceae bacterium]|nr:MAG: hypothetical protein EOO11_08220 [Chitinophagaceae bacterium]